MNGAGHIVVASEWFYYYIVGSKIWLTGDFSPLNWEADAEAEDGLLCCWIRF